MGAQDRDETQYQMTYQGAAAANVVVSAVPAYLHSIIIGKKVTNGVVEVSNHASDGDGDVVLYIENANARTIWVNALFDVGIAVDMTLQTNCTFVWR